MTYIEEEQEELKPSKSQIKRELLALQDLGRELAALSVKDLKVILESDSLREAVLEAKQLKMAALKRQLKHIGKLLRDEDAEAIRQALTTLGEPHAKAVDEFHEVEKWRDDLLAGDTAVFTEISARFAELDHQYVRQLVRNAKKEQDLNKPPKSARVLFRYLNELVQNEVKNKL